MYRVQIHIYVSDTTKMIFVTFNFLFSLIVIDDFLVSCAIHSFIDMNVQKSFTFTRL